MSLPPATRAITRATTEAVEAARAGDPVAFEAAAAALAACEPEPVRLVLAVVVRDLLEQLSPDGLAGDDLLELIRNCARSAFGWYPAIDVQALVVVLTGALGLAEGLHEDEDGTFAPAPYTPLDVARHAPLFITELLAAGPADAPAPDRYLAHAFDQIRTAQLNDSA